jgi:filamentous hemagglutinin family protein
MRSAALLLIPIALFSLPQGAKVEMGSAELVSSPDHLDIRASDKAVIHWDEFSIGVNETARFLQPSPESIAVNRIGSGNLTSIEGLLSANGKIVLFNPSGIFIGPEGRVDTGSFLATTLNFSDEELMSGAEIRFFGERGSIRNEGMIRSDGSIVFISPEIANAGELSSNEIRLGSGIEVFLTPDGRERLRIPASRIARSETGIAQSGNIAGQTVELKADGSLYAIAINSTGVIDARSRTEAGGKVFLVANEGTIEESGKIAACAADRGGEIQILGTDVNLKNEAHLDLSGPSGGGTLRLGALDLSDMQRSRSVVVEEGVRIDASCQEIGDGGDIALFGTERSICLGSLLAEGGAKGGNGGFIEISSYGQVLPAGTISTLAPLGKIGTLLLDPCQVEIKANGGVDSAGVGFAAGSYSFPATATTILDNGLLGARLNASNVVINASTGGGTSPFGSITFTDGINPGVWTAATSLTLIANDSPSSFIQFNDTVIASYGFHPITTVVFDLDSPRIQVGNFLGTSSNGLDIIATSGAINIQTDQLLCFGEMFDANFFAGGHITVLVNGNIHLKTGTGATAKAFLESSNGNISISCDNLFMDADTRQSYIFAGDDVNILAGAIAMVGQGLISSNSGNIFISCDNLSLDGGLGSSTVISTTPTFFIDIEAAGDIALTSSATGITSISEGTITIDCNNLTLTSSAAQLSEIDTSAGDVTVIAAGNILLDATPGSTTTIATAGSDLLVTAGGSITLLAASSISNTSMSGNLEVIAGIDLFIGTGSSILSSAVGDLTLAVDNLFPSSPSFGSGSFTIQSGGAVTHSGGGPVRIFTVAPQLNSIQELLNGFPFLAAGFLVDTGQEQWCTYYPSQFFVGPGFTLFYKLCDSFFSVQEGIFDLFFALNPFDWINSYYENFTIADASSARGKTVRYSILRDKYFENVGRTNLPAIIPFRTFIAENTQETLHEDLHRY